MRILLTDNELIINDISSIISFNDKEFTLNISNDAYIIKGENLILKEVYDNNTSIKIIGSVYLIEKQNHKNTKEKKSFLKRLLS